MRTTCLASSLSPSSSPVVGKAWGCGALDRVWLNPVEKARLGVGGWVESLRRTEEESGQRVTPFRKDSWSTSCGLPCIRPTTFHMPGIGHCTRSTHIQLVCTDTIIQVLKYRNTYILVDEQLPPSLLGLPLGHSRSLHGC